MFWVILSILCIMVGWIAGYKIITLEKRYLTRVASPVNIEPIVLNNKLSEVRREEWKRIKSKHYRSSI